MNTVRANITSSRYAETNSIFQYDTGRKLEIYGCNLPKSVEVQFSTDKEKGNTITRVGNTNNGVTATIIPNQLLNDSEKTSNFYIFAFLYNVDNDGGRTEYVIKIPVVARPKPENPSEEPLPEQNIFHATVVAVNASAERAEKAASDAEDIRDNLNLDLSEKITRPQTAEVGQVLAVKEIDESGTPTVFEAEDVKVPTKTSELENDSGFLTEHQDISGKLDAEKLPEAIDTALTQAKESGVFDGKDGADGKDGTPGPKGDPGETTYIENPYDDTKLKTEVDKKLTTPTGNAKVGQILRVQSVNNDGSVVLETVEMPTESVSDIQINGNSIVGNSGIAEIPIASQGKPGVLGIPGEVYGLAKDLTNNIRLIGLTNGEVDKRFYAKPLTGNTLDYAVKAAMCDGKGAAWTVEEQANARERIGITDLKKIVSATLEEESLINITLDKDGNAFDYDETYIRLIIPKTIENISTSIAVGDLVFYAGSIANASYNMNYFDIYAKRMNGIGFCEYISHTNSENNLGNVRRSIVRENIRKFYKFGTYKPFPAGTQIIIYAR